MIYDKICFILVYFSGLDCVKLFNCINLLSKSPRMHCNTLKKSPRMHCWYNLRNASAKCIDINEFLFS